MILYWHSVYCCSRLREQATEVLESLMTDGDEWLSSGFVDESTKVILISFDTIISNIPAESSMMIICMLFFFFTKKH